MRLAFAEIQRARLRFGLLTLATSLIMMLILFLAAISGALIGSLTGAISGMDADVLVYSDTARGNLQGSRLSRESFDRVSSVPGVAQVGAVALTMASAQLPPAASNRATGSDLQVIGINPGKPGMPSGLRQGRLPVRPSEAAVDISGSAIGDTIRVGVASQPLEVVGLLSGAQFAATPTAYTTLETFDQLSRAANPQAPFIPINAVAVRLAPGANPTDVVRQIGLTVPGTTAYTIAAAVDAIPGVDAVSQTFTILVSLAFVVGVVIVGFFFLILTVQKLKPFTLLRAIGTSTAQLAFSVGVQVCAVVVTAGALAIILTLLALRGIATGIPVSLNPAVASATVTAVLAASLVASLFSIRRISSIDPAAATGAG